MSSKPYDFSGKRALVTGAGAGIGRALALTLAELGAQVFALSKTQANLDSLKAENPSIEIICVDVGDWTATREAVKKITPIHLLVNNAGLAVLNPVLEATPEEFDKLFNVNVKSIMNITQVVASDLINRNLKGNIVNISSKVGSRAAKFYCIYSATKAAVDSFTRSMALELSPKGIRVNSVGPTVVLTAMGHLAWAIPGLKEYLLARIPQGKLAEVEDVVNATVFLLSDKSDMINGHMLPVDGGFLCA